MIPLSVTTIPSLPDPLQTVPADRDGWLHWRTRVLAWREIVQRECRSDPARAALHERLAADDPAYFLTMFCPIYEPRETIDFEFVDGEWVPFEKPAGWYPWIPFHFQVDMLRWIVKVKTTSRLADKTGKSDGVCEKSREMGASWLFCLVAAHDFLFGNNQEIGFVSYKEEVVDKGDDSRSLFYKLRALIGIYPKVPEKAFAPDTFWHELDVRLPSFLSPGGFRHKDHNRINHIIHPTKNNALLGNSTSGKTGLGARLSWILIDEGAKNENLLTIWGGLQATTHHRFTTSSADLRWGTDFRDLARNAREAQDYGTNGPAYFRLPWNLHPLRDEGWLESERARSNLDPYQFAREYEMDYYAGFGDWVYPFAQSMQVGPFPYVEGAGAVTGTIDPGIADPTAVGLFQKVPGENRTRLFDAANIKLANAAAWAPVLMGFPEGHPEWEACPPEARALMATMWGFRRDGVKVAWVGDPYGNANAADGSGTFYETLLTESIAKSNQYPDLPPCHLIVDYTYDNDARYFPGRLEALATLLPVLDINDNPGGRLFLAALQEYHYKPEDKTTTERLRPEHSWGSHLVTAAEFYAVNDKIIADVLRFRRASNPGPHMAPAPRSRLPQRPRIQRIA